MSASPGQSLSETCGKTRTPFATSSGADRRAVSDGGLETTLVFHRGLDLPCFAAFDLLKDDAGIAILREYLEPYLEAAPA